jgi:hypothetical protein
LTDPKDGCQTVPQKSLPDPCPSYDGDVELSGCCHQHAIILHERKFLKVLRQKHVYKTLEKKNGFIVTM